MKKIVVLSIVLIYANTLHAQSSQVFKTDNIAIGGYDPVAYFTQQKPILGSKEHNFEWNGATWRFSSEENRNLFAANPEQYAPQYGGYCAYGTADGHKAPTQPDAWSIVDNKLYFNYNKKVQTEWQKNQAEYIKKADANWPVLKNSN